MAIEWIAAKSGCTAEARRQWVRRHERDTGQRAGPGAAGQPRIKALGARGQAKLREASAYFAQAALDRPLKP